MFRHAVFTAFLLSLLSNYATGNTVENCISKQLDNANIDISAAVNGAGISEQELIVTIQLESRKRFYHATAPEGQTLEFRDEIVDQLINTRLLSNYAYFDQGIQVEDAAIRLKNLELDEELADKDLSDGQITTIKTYYICSFERETLVAKLRKLVEDNTTVTPVDVQQYYRQHPEKFTSPIRNRIGLILIGVHPSAAAEAWVEAKTKADQLYFALNEGAVFEQLAAEHSTDISARHGGDMGYQHQGMLGNSVETAAESLEPGQFSEPMYLLEGWAIVRLIEREPAELNPFEAVAERAEGLTLRDAKEAAWNALVTQLRDTANITYNLE